ncbi:hypothetical protein LAD12857_14350 [Lacrimispora amygdalina]|uniref:Uncharacterized protein n=1 Tax=Lacrimispora amygdalina TaxID=253257 RepID=A0A3E2N890_9FIRM|nr:hypothetical protein [Clostridium indicum]RFZ77130.1 hypothetical protein DS742_20175 [Clostridium indicum]
MNMIVYNPQTEEDKKELGRRAAVIHNQVLMQTVRLLHCPNDQKKALLNAIKAESTQTFKQPE